MSLELKGWWQRCEVDGSDRSQRCLEVLHIPKNIQPNPKGVCGGKASIRLDWTFDCKFDPQKQLHTIYYMMCVAPTALWFHPAMSWKLDSYTMTFFMSEKTCLCHSVLYRLDYVSVVREGSKPHDFAILAVAKKSQGIQHQALRRFSCLEVNFERSKPFWPWHTRKAQIKHNIHEVVTLDWYYVYTISLYEICFFTMYSACRAVDFHELLKSFLQCLA